jgi:hypothetical protein
LKSSGWRRPFGAPRFHYGGCQLDFPVTGSTLLASRKAPFPAWLAAIADVKGKAGLPRSRHTGTNWKAAFVLLRKLGHWSKGSECT